MPKDDEVDNLKWEIINENNQDIIIKTKLISQYVKDFNIELNDFLLKISDKKIIEIKYATHDMSSEYKSVLYTALIIYEDKVIKNKVIKKEDIIAVEIPNVERKIYNIKEEK